MGRVPRVMTQEEDKYKDQSPKRFRTYVTPSPAVADPWPLIGPRLLLVPLGIQREVETMTSLNILEMLSIRLSSSNDVCPSTFCTFARWQRQAATNRQKERKE